MSLFTKFPSYDYIIKQVVTVIKRFPFTVLSALIGTIVAVNLIDIEFSKVAHILIKQRILITAALGLPLFTGLQLLGEKKEWKKATSIVVQLCGLIILIGYYFSLPEDAFKNVADPIRFLLINISLHFFVAFIPYIGGDELQGFWQYNKSLFLRILTSALYSSVLYFGLSLALAALDNLFGLEVREVRYFQLWVIIVGIINTFIFLGGIPEKIQELNADFSYPKGLKVFTQYILLPLVVLYFFILITYELKIIITWNWPKGWVSQLVLWYSVVGILSLLLLHPLRKKTENKWIQVFSKWFFIALVPFVVMLFFAIFRRISDYGITEPRYYVLAMAIGLSIVVLYFIISKRKDIRAIPIVLCLIAILSAYGPWSSFAISQKSQVSRLEDYLVKNEMLVNGELQKPSKTIPFEDRKEMSSIIDHLEEWNGLEPFLQWFDDSTLNAKDTIDSDRSYRSRSKITKLFGFEFVSYWETEDQENQFDISVKSLKSLNIEGYKYIFDYNYDDYDTDEFTIKTFDIAHNKYFITFDSVNNAIRIRHGESFETSKDTLALTIDSLVIRNTDSSFNAEFDIDKLSLQGIASGINSKILIKNMHGTRNGDSVHVSSLNAYILMK